MYFYHFFIAFIGLSIREIKKFSMQKGRLFSAIVRPALWLFVFAAGVGSAKGVDPGILNFYPIQNINYFEYYGLINVGSLNAINKTCQKLESL